MYFTIKPKSDTYITDRVINNVRSFTSNVGNAGTIDIFKIYGLTFSGSFPNNELSRGLISFDYTDLKQLVADQMIDMSNSSFKCTLKMFDVYGGQPTPANFTLIVYPLSQSFDEGIGRDVVRYSDHDTANFLTASYVTGNGNLWFASGANQHGFLGSSNIDIISSGNLGFGTTNLWVTQSFITGNENLCVDVTQIVSATLAGLLPDCGFRVSFIESQENDQRTRFVKRFAARLASNPAYHPRITMKYDDSIQDNTTNFTFDNPGSIFLYNSVQGVLSPIVSGSSFAPVTGSNSLLLRLETYLSGVGTITKYVTASQHKVHQTYFPGIYSASFTLASNDVNYKQLLLQSGSVTFSTVWQSLDNTVDFVTSSNNFVVLPISRGSSQLITSDYYVNVINVQDEYRQCDLAKLRVFIQDNNAAVKLQRTFFDKPSVILSIVHYSIRDAVTNKIVIPFDLVNNSTRLSSGADGLTFNLPMNNFDIGRVYAIDIMIIENGVKKIYENAGTSFRIEGNS